MKKFILLYVGTPEYSPEVLKGWTKWFEVLGQRVVDSGNPFGPGKEVTKTGNKDLDQGEQALAGYTIVNAESLEEITKLTEQCPIITSIRIYEAMPM